MTPPRTPSYVHVTAALRELALAQPWAVDRPLPPEKDLAEHYGVSRGTLRRATEELVREGLLSSEPGRGTFVVRKTQIRLLMEDGLRAIARPDSRWHLDVSKFVPDFEGSERCHGALRELPAYRAARTVFITPDNSLQAAVHHALDDGKAVLVPTYGLRRGIVLLDDVALADRAFAATLDGLERFGRTLDVDGLRAVGTVDLIVSGATALTRAGLHIGGESGFFGLEWAILADLGLVEEATPIVAVVHDIQVLDIDLSPGPEDLGVDTVLTPTETIHTHRAFARPTGARPLPAGGALDHLPYLRELRRPTLRK
ncbi:5-formyltetrahydrofolate cyclo-ligase [Georgenia ruanii]|uniref:5-formyltetrahydrofolate cyclo-ligase n=1 Tax=Georgenia ruanii TaxID=348442 RepID=UPI0012641A5E|nr:5-formyltetrahydrofolate cyclo-ligase [Georgenia ruanii]